MRYLSFWFSRAARLLSVVALLMMLSAMPLLSQTRSEPLQNSGTALSAWEALSQNFIQELEASQTDLQEALSELNEALNEAQGLRIYSQRLTYLLETSSQRMSDLETSNSQQAQRIRELHGQLDEMFMENERQRIRLESQRNWIIRLVAAVAVLLLLIAGYKTLKLKGISILRR